LRQRSAIIVTCNPSVAAGETSASWPIPC